MENASKALIIAGAILLAILLIGLGVYIYNQASNTIGETGMDQVAARQFNGKFEPYINKTIDSTAAKALIDTVKQSNQTGKGRIELLNISEKSQIMTGHKYTVTPDYQNGVITGIVIVDENGSSIDPGTILEEDIGVRDFDMQFYGYVKNPYPGEIDPNEQIFERNIIKDLQKLVEISNNRYPNHYITLILPSDFLSHPGDSYYNSIPAFNQKGYIIRIEVSLRSNANEEIIK